MTAPPHDPDRVATRPPLPSYPTMAAFLTPRARARAADFRQARIALHPGPVDRLW